jgi:hypothetical protein
MKTYAWRQQPQFRLLTSPTRFGRASDLLDYRRILAERGEFGTDDIEAELRRRLENADGCASNGRDQMAGSLSPPECRTRWGLRPHLQRHHRAQTPEAEDPAPRYRQYPSRPQSRQANLIQPRRFALSAPHRPRDQEPARSSSTADSIGCRRRKQPLRGALDKDGEASRRSWICPAVSKDRRA